MKGLELSLADAAMPKDWARESGGPRPKRLVLLGSMRFAAPDVPGRAAPAAGAGVPFALEGASNPMAEERRGADLIYEFD